MSNFRLVPLKRIRNHAVQSLSVISLQRLVQVAGVAATVVLVPRLFGPVEYGHFAFVLALSYLGQIAGDFGSLDVMGRFVPGFSPPEVSRLYMRTLAFKIGVGLVCGLGTVAAALLLARWIRLEWALLAGLGVGLHIVAWVPFQLSLGLSQIGAWMSEQAWRQWVLLGLLLLLLPPLGLTGALVAVVLMEAIFCVLGFWWTRSYWRLPELRLDWHYLRPYLKFGLGFFLANLATVALYRSGPVLVETLTGQARQTGYLNLGLGLFLMVYITVSQFAQGLIPTLSRFQDQGQPNEVRKWLRKFATYGWLFGWLGTLVVWSTADWAVPRLFGAGYAPVAPVLKWISLGLPLTALLWAGNVTATVTRRGRLKFQASLAALATFLTATLWLTPVFLAVGSALALGLATLVNVVVLSWALRSDFAPNWTVLWQSATAAGLSLGVLVWLS